MNKKLVIIGAVIIAILILIKSIVWKTPLVEVVSPQRGLAVDAVYAMGVVEGTVMYPVSPQITGKLTDLLTDEGQEVTAGQVLAKLESGEYSENLRQLEVRETLAFDQFKKQEKLWKQQAISEDEFNRFKTEWLASKAATSAAQSRVNYLTLKATTSGKIIRRDGEVGQLISANQNVFWISCCGPLRISADVDEEDIAKIKVGQKVKLQADAFGDEIFNGKVQQITLKGDPILRSYRVRIEFEKTALPLMIGMTVENNIIVNEIENALLIPTSSLLGDEVLVVDNDKIAKRRVDIGVRGKTQTQVKNGLLESEVIVKNPTAKLEDGADVSVKSANAK